jgi:hypothetical protein
MPSSSLSPQVYENIVDNFVIKCNVKPEQLFLCVLQRIKSIENARTLFIYPNT